MTRQDFIKLAISYGYTDESIAKKLEEIEHYYDNESGMKLDMAFNGCTTTEELYEVLYDECAMGFHRDSNMIKFTD